MEEKVSYQVLKEDGVIKGFQVSFGKGKSLEHLSEVDRGVFIFAMTEVLHAADEVGASLDTEGSLDSLDNLVAASERLRQLEGEMLRKVHGQ